MSWFEFLKRRKQPVVGIALDEPIEVSPCKFARASDFIKNAISPEEFDARFGEFLVKKHVIYKCNGKKIHEVVDTDGETTIPAKDTVIELAGKKYKVLTEPTWETGAAGALRIFTVYLEEI